MTWYELWLFLHIAAAAIWVGGGTMIQLFALPVLASGDAGRLAEFAQSVERIANRALVPASLGALLTGFALVINGEFVELGDDWIVIGLVLFGITFLAGAAFFGPEAGRIAKQVQAEGAEAAVPRIRRILVLTRIDLMVLFLIIFDMSVKPSFDDGWTIVGGLAGAAALAVLLTVPTLRAGPVQARG
jgi:uncharacterized membrane protein